jgi:hypothetical protein
MLSSNWTSGNLFGEEEFFLSPCHLQDTLTQKDHEKPHYGWLTLGESSIFA